MRRETSKKTKLLAFDCFVRFFAGENTKDRARLRTTVSRCTYRNNENDNTSSVSFDREKVLKNKERKELHQTR